MSRGGEPAPIGEAMLQTTREWRCPCGKTFAQWRFSDTWAPNTCPACAAVEEAAQAERDAETKRLERRAAALASLDVPLLYKNATVDSFDVRGEGEEGRVKARIAQLARRYVGMWDTRQADDHTFPQIVVFTGEPGTGKGHIAWAIARAVAVEYNDTVKFTVLSDCIRDLREAWSQRRGDGPSEAARLIEYRRPELLIVDEVSDHAFFGQPTQHLYDLVAWREQRLLPTILTTNAGKPDLAAMLGPALVSRVSAWKGAFWDFGNVDYRATRRRNRMEAA